MAAFAACFILTSCNTLTDDGDSHVQKGSDLMAHGRNRDAETEFRRALELPLVRFSREKLYTIMGNNFYERGLYDSAIVYHRKAIEKNANYAEAYVNLGIAYRHEKEYAQAEEAYLKAKVLNPKDAKMLSSLGALYIAMERVEEGTRLLEESLQLDSKDAIAHANYATALAKGQNFEKAEAEQKMADSLGYKNGDNLRDYIQMQKDSAGVPVPAEK
jgi:tetratricopeptide (TPR) repeat protein